MEDGAVTDQDNSSLLAPVAPTVAQDKNMGEPGNVDDGGDLFAETFAAPAAALTPPNNESQDHSASGGLVGDEVPASQASTLKGMQAEASFLVDSDEDEYVFARFKASPSDTRFDMQNLLANLAEYWINVVKDNADCCRGNVSTLPPKIDLVSLCAGSGTGELTLELSCDIISAEYLRPLWAKILLVAEKVPWKQRFLETNILHSKPEACVYDDVKTLADMVGMNCIRHNNAPTCAHRLATKSSRMLKSGFSCTAYSKMNTSFQKNKSAMERQDDQLTSVITFNATTSIIEQYAPDVFVLENVDSIGDEECENSNLQLCIERMESLTVSYKVKIHRVLTSKYFLPQRRLRVYIIGLKLSGGANGLNSDSFHAGVTACLDAMQMPCPSLRNIVEPDDSAFVAMELERRQAARKQADDDLEAKARLFVVKLCLRL
jgi:site-specific DNA-cytosine methylase